MDEKTDPQTSASPDENSEDTGPEAPENEEELSLPEEEDEQDGSFEDPVPQEESAKEPVEIAGEELESEIDQLLSRTEEEDLPQESAKVWEAMIIGAKDEEEGPPLSQTTLGREDELVEDARHEVEVDKLDLSSYFKEEEVDIDDYINSDITREIENATDLQYNLEKRVPGNKDAQLQDLIQKMADKDRSLSYFLDVLLEKLETVVAEEGLRPGTLGNVIKSRGAMDKAHQNSLQELRKRGFSLAEFQGQVQEEEVEDNFKAFLQRLKESRELCQELDDLKDEYPQYIREINDLTGKLRDLGGIEETRELLDQKRTIFKIRTVIDQFKVVGEEFKDFKVRRLEIEDFVTHQNFELLMKELQDLHLKYNVEPGPKLQKRFGKLSSRLEERGIIETQDDLKKLLTMNPEIFKKLVETLEQDLDTLDFLDENLDKKEMINRSSDNYRKIQKHRDDPSFLFMTIKRFVEMELNTRAKILGK